MRLLRWMFLRRYECRSCGSRVRSDRAVLTAHGTRICQFCHGLFHSLTVSRWLIESGNVSKGATP